MSEFRGLHNPERHRLLSDGTTFCDDSDEDVETYWGCIEDCYPDDPCRCCLAAEVEALRAQVQAVRDVCDAATAANDAYNQPLNEHERRIGRPSIGVAVATVDVSRILRALDGGDA